jgi:hypothetical protein
VFERLDRMAAELRRDRSRPKLAQAITLYHLVIEASLAQPGQHFIDEGLTRRELLPGLRAGVANVARDEQRHIAFGVKMIADLVREDPDCRPAIEELLRETMPFTSAVFVPPEWDERYIAAMGFTLEEIFAHGADALDGRLRAAGLDPTEMRLGLPFELPATERARRGLTLLRAGYLGEPGIPVKPTPEATELLFDGLRRTVDASVAPGARIMWDFSDAEPWHLRIDNGATSVSPGRIENADLTFHCRFEDFVDLTAGRSDPLRSLLRGKVRLTGKLRMIARAPRLFA